MKSLAIVMIVLALVVGVAVNGSRAQTIQATGVAFNQCQGDTAIAADRCRSLGQIDQTAPAWLVDALWGYALGKALDFVFGVVFNADPDAYYHSNSSFWTQSAEGCAGQMPCQRPESPTASTMFDPARAGTDNDLVAWDVHTFVWFEAFVDYDADGCSGLRPCLDPDRTDTTTTRVMFDPVQ